MSVAMFGAAFPMKNFEVSRHFEWTLESQKPLMGVQVNMAPKEQAIAQAQQTAPTMRAATAKPLPGNTDVYSRRMVSLMDVMQYT